MARDEPLIRAQKAYEEKTSKLNVRLKPEEREKLEALAAAAGITPTTLIKRWIEKGKVR
jgi:predicted DNA-binding protein